jgi:hypothetical protein
MAGLIGGHDDRDCRASSRDRTAFNPNSHASKPGD